MFHVTIDVLRVKYIILFCAFENSFMYVHIVHIYLCVTSICLSARVCMWVHCANICMCMQWPEDNLGYQSSETTCFVFFFFFLLIRQHFSLGWHLQSSPGWPAILRDLSVSTSPVLRLQVCITMLNFSYVDSSSGSSC